MEPRIRKIITPNQAPIVRRVNNAIHRIILNPLYSAIRFVNTYPLERDLSKGYRFLPFEQLGLEQRQISHPAKND